jgi:tRNA(fMet)-specific endonuclease VapC
MPYLLDTNTLSYAFRNQGACRQRMQVTPDEQIRVCSISYFELAYGMALMPQPAALHLYTKALRQRYGCVDFDHSAADAAGQLRAKLRLLGTPIGEYDLLIAGSALANNLTVVTHNTREFSRVPGLQLEDWYA